ncbi:MAG TPA: outer membrane beta-barrel protein [Kofleriaceae bacterium]|nr:outer membrane beta-barrel protein [Kofleriaceae bacterium]
MNHARLAILFAVLGMMAPGLAHAQAASRVGGSRLWIGGHLGLSPIGSLEASAQGFSSSVDAASAFEIGGLVDYRLTPIFSIGFAPTVVLHVKGTGDSDSGSELDLPLRVTAGSEVAPRIRLYGFVTPGFSILYPPSNGQGDTPHPSGFMIGFGGGAGYHVAPRVMLTGELGYQFRFLSDTVAGVDATFHVNYLTLSVGAAFALD